MKIKQILFFVTLLVSSFTFSQTYTMGAGIDGTTIETCSGTFYDSGGPSSLYSANEDYTVTFCPDLATNPGSVIRVEFAQFNTEGTAGACTDVLQVWYAPDNTGPVNVEFCGDLTAAPFTLNSSSADGCITFQFTSNNTSQKIGWVGNISCYVPCTPPVADLAGNNVIDLCVPDAGNNNTVSFDASGSTSVAGTTVTTYEWDWGDGLVETSTVPNMDHDYDVQGIYQVNLVVRSSDTTDDPLGCQSPPFTQMIRVMPNTSFVGTSGVETGSGNAPATTITIDCGDTVDLVGLVTSQTETQSAPILDSGIIDLPDDQVEVYEEQLNFAGYFPAGATVTPGCYPTVNFELEHSWSGDLKLELRAPNGQTVILFLDHVTDSIKFGTCVNDSNVDGEAGCVASYSVVGDGTGVDWPNASGAFAGITQNTPPANGTCPEFTGTCSSGNYFIPQTYNSDSPFTPFDGSQLNGNWTLIVQDTWQGDNGFLKSWGITFPSSCYGTLETVTPDLIMSSTSGVWEHTGTGPVLPAQNPTSTVVANPGPDGCPGAAVCEGTQITNNVTVGPFDVGAQTYTYTYVVTDEFGCEHEQDIIINVSDNCTECTLDLSSAAGTDTQNVCVNTAISDITYLAGNEVTDVTVDAGLPAGVTGSYNAATSTFTITGTPDPGISGTFNYTVSTVGCLGAVVVTQQGTIVVTEIPVANAVPNLRLCDTDNNGSESFDFAAQTVAVLNGQAGMTVSYYDSQVNADAGTATGLITSPYVNTADPETIFIRVENGVNSTCFSTTSFTIDIDPSPIANAVANPEMRLCDVGADGTENYDLTSFAAEVIGVQTNTVVTYYDGNNVVIATPATYAGTLAQEIITIEVDFTDAANVCNVATTTVTIFLDAIPVANAVPNLRLCDTDNNGSESFDFAAQTVAVLNGQTGMTVSYYDSQVNADAGTATGLITSPYANTADPETIFIRVENGVNSTCFSTTSFTIDIDPSPIANAVANPEMRLCDVGADGTENYDLTSFAAEVIGVQTNTVVTYYDGNNVVIATPATYAGTLAQEIITIEVDFTDAANVCNVATTTVTIFLDAIPVANAVPNLRLCDTDNNGSESFDFAAQTVAVLNGQTGMTVSYYDSQVNADAGTATGLITSPYANTADPETIFIRVENGVNSTCFSTTSFTIDIDPSPIANAVANPEMRLCDVGADGTENYDLTSFAAEVIGGQTNTVVTYYDGNNVVIATPATYAGTLAQEIITIEVDFTDVANVCNVATTTVTIFLDAIPVANAVPNLRLCDTDNNGSESFDFAAQTVAVLNGQTGMTVSYYDSQVNADAGTVTGLITSPYVNTADPETIFIRVENGVNSTCFSTTSFTIDIDPSPIANAVANPEMRLCDVGADGTENYDLTSFAAEVIGVQTNTVVTYYDGNNVVIATPATYAGTLAQEIITIEVGINNPANPGNLCNVATTTVTVFLDPLPTLPTNPLALVYKECDTDIIDGITTFDEFDNQTALIVGNNNYTVTYHETLAFAQANTNVITNGYTNNSSPNTQLIGVRIVDVITGCINTMEITLEVVTAPQAFPFTNPLTYCDTDNDDVGYFDLSSIVVNLTGGLPVDVAFYETVAEADAQQGAIDTSVLYENINSDADGDNNPATQTIFAQLSIPNLACSTLVPVNLVVIKSPELPSDELVYKQCEELPDITDGVVFFDLTSYELTNLYTEIINAGGDPAEYTTSYYHSDVAGNIDYTNPINNPNAYENIETPDQLIYVVVEHTGSVSVPATGCSTIKAITLHVDLLPVAIYTPIEVCDDNDVNSLPPNNTSDGIIEFDLTDYIGQITGGATGVTVEFYTTAIAAEAGLGAATVPSIDFIDTPTAYENEFNPQAIFARVLNPSTGCYAVAIVRLHVNPNPTPLSTSEIETTLGNGGIMEECDGNVDGSGDISEQIATFDLTLWETAILNGENGVSAVYYANADDAAAETNAIQNPATYNNISNPQTIYVSVVNDGFGINPVTAGTGCNTVVTFQLFVPVPTVEVTPSKTVICVDANGVPLTDTTLPVLTANALPLAPYDYQWMLNGVTIPGATNSVFTVTEHGDYTVAVSGPTDFDCINVSSTVTIEVSGVPDGFDANVTTNAFAESHQIVATATSSTPGIEFWYSLDDGEPTTNGTFENVSPGAHVVTISDGKNCWTENIDVTLIDYPHFFTPNGDGVNDTWRIIGQEGIPISQIYIFDRFGKLLSQLDPDGEGWDGTYNGSQMPASDYWFKILYIEGADSSQKEFKAHFSLKR